MVLIAFLYICLWPVSVDQEVDSTTLKKGLVVDLDADRGVISGADNRVEKWINQVESFAVKPGVESFVGEIARFLLYERPLTKNELMVMATELKRDYNL